MSVYQIPYNGKKDICYRFVDSENLINEDTLFLNGEVLLYKRENVNESKHESTIGKLKKEQNHLWLLIEQMVKSADKENEIEDGRVYRSEKAEDIIWRIYVNYETGHYLNLERDRKGYDWTGGTSYDIELKGEHPNTIGMYFRDYTQHSLFDKKFGGPFVYPITPPEEICEFFNRL